MNPSIQRAMPVQLAVTLSHLDPGALEYHAEGRADEYLQDFDLDSALEKIRCPVLLLQGDPSMNGMMTDRSVDTALSRLDQGYHVLMEGAGHDLGLDSWEIGPLLKTGSTFLATL